jgi:hypothetical protein
MNGVLSPEPEHLAKISDHDLLEELVAEARNSMEWPNERALEPRQAEVARRLKERERLHYALNRLVQRYVKGRGSHSQFIAVVNIEGSSSPEWDEALLALGLGKAPKR